MKSFIGITSLTLIVIFSTFQTSLTSCTKDKTIYDTVTVTKTDTVVIKDTAISLQLLTANSWKVQELRGVSGNTPVYYLRGGTSNTDNFDNEYITFKSDKTGTYFDAAGGTHALTWDFSNSANTKITFVVQNPSAASQTVVYENLRYKNGALLFDQYWTYNGVYSHGQGIRIPK